MAEYTVKILPDAEHETASLPQGYEKLVRKKIARMADNPYPLRQYGKVRGTKKAEPDLYRARQGKYRILYTVDETAKVVTVISVQHRRDIYRS